MNGAIIRSLIVGLVMAASILEGCTQKDWQLLREWRDEWMEEHNLRVTDDQGEFDLGRAIGAGINYLVSERDPEVEAALGAYTVIDNINRSDKLMEEGRQNRDAEKMDQAIQNRPGDWTYRTSRGALAIEHGDVETAQQQFDTGSHRPAGEHRPRLVRQPGHLRSAIHSWSRAYQLWGAVSRLL